MADIALTNQFRDVLGRLPSQDELDYFQKFITEGRIQPQEVGQILQSTPEFQQTQLNKNTEAYGQRLDASNNEALQRGADVAGAQAQSRFAGLGRPNSSALAASVFGQTGQLAGQLAQQKQSALASFYGQGLQTNQNAYAQQGQGILNNAYGMRDEERIAQRNRNWEIEDYYRQQNDEQNAQHGINRTFGSPLLGRTFNGIFNLGAAYLGGKAGSKTPAPAPK